MPPRLLLRSAILDGESLKGYLMRLALLNGYRNLDWLLRAANINSSLFDRGSSSLNGLAAFTGRAVPELEAIYWPASVIHRHRSSQHQLADTTVPAWLLNVRHPRICPRCIREGRPMQRTWDIAWITCCPRHGNYLVSQCSKCHKALSWNRPWLHRCDCGFGLPALPARQAPAAEIALSALLGERFAKESVGSRRQVLPDWLHALPATKLPSFLLTLSALELHAKTPQQRSSMSLDVGVTVSATTWLAELLSKWPDSLIAHLKRAVAHLSGPECHRGQMVRLRGAIRELMADDAPAEMRGTLQSWLAASHKQAEFEPGGVFYELTSDHQPRAKRLESQRIELGLGKHVFSYALSKIEIPTAQGKDDTPCEIDPFELQKQKLKQLITRWHASLSERQAADALGLPRRDIRSLIRAGLLKLESIPSNGQKFSKRFHQEQLDKLLSRTLALAKPLSEPILPDLNELPAIREHFGRRAYIGHLLACILAGKLECYRPPQIDTPKLSQLWLDLRKVATHLSPAPHGGSGKLGSHMPNT